MSKPRILLLSAYDATSHRRWRQQLVEGLPQFHWEVLTLPPRFFRWRIRGNALTWLAEPQLQASWDLILATSMVDLAGLRAFQPQLAGTPAVLYMHENQFAFPQSSRQHSSAEPRMVNLYSALSAEWVLFNSEWNRQSFLDGMAGFLERMPDGVPTDLHRRVQAKSRILPVPIEDRHFVKRTGLNSRCPHLLWNHRWEYDKGPDRLLRLLDRLVEADQPFRLSLVGEQFRRWPAAFDEIREQHGRHLHTIGFVESRTDYEALLAAADVVISTALHDFQGLAMLEAMAAGCLALAPERLAYPEYIPAAQRYSSHRDDAEAEARAAEERLLALLHSPPAPTPPDQWRASQLLPRYRETIEALLTGAPGSAASPRRGEL